MDLISAAERLAAMDHPAVVYNPDRCLLAIDKFSTCERCVEVCPAQAIQPGSPPAFDSEACAECLACLPDCPAGAFSGQEELGQLLTCLARIPNGPVEILCAKNPRPELGVSTGATAVRIRHCLAGLGAGGFLAMAALDIRPIFIRTEACQDCEFSRLAGVIQRQLGAANQILQSLKKPAIQMVATIEAIHADPTRKCWQAHNPPISRRDLFHMLGSTGKLALARALAQENPSESRRPSLDHRRIVAAIRQILSDNPAPTTRIESSSFATVQVSSECTACGTCVRSCPNGALELAFDQAQEQFLLAVRPTDCNGCEVCSHVCGPQAIQIDHSPGLREIFSATTFRILAEGSLQRCQRCNQLFAPAQEAKLCPVCEYRRDHPFSVGLPPHLRAN